jgi:hypothetical protein
MMELPAAILEKIRSDELRSEAVAETSEQRSVIVELDLPMPKLEMGDRRTEGLRGKAHFRFAAPTPEDIAEAGQEDSKITASKEDIATITGRLPDNYLSTAGSFVVRANGEQIGRIARMSTVSAIWPNSKRGR